MNNDLVWWGALLMATLGTYFWRGLGVLLSGRINQEGEFFRWLSAVTYALVAALTFRLILLPVGLLAEVPTIYRILFSAIAVLVMMRKPGRMVPSLIIGSLIMMIYGLVKIYMS
jgi:hypothetical protein